MRSIKKLIKLIFFLAALIAIVIAVGVYFPAPKAPDVGFKDVMLIQDVNIIDIESGQVLANQNVLINEGRIINISQDNIRPKDTLTIIIEGTDKYLIPGLWDMHSQSIKRSPYIHHPLFIANGVTHLRDLSGCLNQDDAYWACTDDRKRWNSKAQQGLQVNPIYHEHSNHPLAGGKEIPDEFPEYLKSNAVEKSNGLVQYAKSQKADTIVIEKDLARRVYFGLALEAQKHQISLSGNIPFNASLPDAISAKQKSIDEASIFSFACYNNSRQLLTAANTDKFESIILEDVVAQQDPIKCGTLMTTMASSNSWWSPNLQSLKNKYEHNNSKTSKFAPLVYKYLFWKFEKKNSLSVTAKNAHDDLFTLAAQQVNMAKNAGVKIIAGSNAAGNQLIAGESLHDELADMVDGGMTTLQALQSATLSPAIFSNAQSDYGTIDIGKKADLVLLNANPLESIDALGDIEALITQERYLDRDELDKLLSYSEAQAKSWHQNIKLFWESISSPLQRKVLSDARKQSSEE